MIAEHPSQARELSATKQLLLERLRNGQLTRMPTAGDAQLVRRRASVAPMSYGQEQIWLSTQLCPTVPMYNECVTVGHRGPLDVPALQWSFNEVLRRHEAWRTTFAVRDGQPVQIVHEPRWRELAVIDLTNLPAQEREEQALRLATEDARGPIDAEHGPLIRAQLACLSDIDQRLFLTMHHITFDGVALYNVFLPELVDLYEAYRRGDANRLPDPPLQYPDYAAWQRETLAAGRLDRNLAFWREQLGNAPAELCLPTDRARPPSQTFKGALEPLALPAQLSDDLQALSRREGVTLYVTLLSAFGMLLQRYSGQADFVVGTVTAGRNRSELRGLLGYFLNVIALRLDASPELTVRELLARTREITLDAFSHDETPFELLLRELKIERTPGRSPLFQVMFTLEPPISAVGQEWSLSQLDVDTGTAKFDLSVELDERPEGIIGRFEYNTSIFERATIRQMMRHWQRILEEMVRDTGQVAGRLPLLSDAELHQQIVGWNDTAVPYALDGCLHELVEAQVQRTPDAIAVEFEGQQLNYRQLDERANQLAHQLRSMGVGPDVLVSIAMERSLELVVGLLGILKAGGAYVPLDPSYPPERLAFMLEDAAAPVLLTQQALLGSTAPHAGQRLCLDSDWPAIAQQPVTAVACEASANSLAYVIYTSGSTGRPKGVMNTHRAIRNRLLWMQAAYQLTPDDRVVQKTPFSFDVSVWEFFWPLLAGARLVLAVPGGHREPAYLRRLFVERGITTAHFVPAMLRAFLQEPGLDACTSLRRVICSGAALPFDLQERCFARLPRAELHNLYGPTEAAVDVSSWACRAGDPPGSVPIGRPIANVQLYILDPRQQPVPIGVAGELYIGGVAVARGYLNRPELTAERFVPDPFSLDPLARLYRTGDLVRYRDDGAIEFLGRADDQVKIHGFRIELGEVEAALTALDSVHAAAVSVREDRPGQKRLTGYVVPASSVNGDELRAELQQRLPAYMVPSDMVLLGELPIGPTGKVDRAKLPAPHRSAKTSSQAPRDETESAMARLFEDLLETSPVGVDDNFFALGGDSLLAVRLLAGVASTLGVEVPLSCMWEDATVAYLASVVRRDLPSTASRSPLLRLREGTKRPFFCVAAVDGNGFWFAQLAQRLEANRPFVAFRSTWSDARDRRPASVQDVAAGYVEHLRQAQPEGPYLLGGYSYGGAVALEMAQQLLAQGQRIGLLAMLDSGPSHWEGNPGWSFGRVKGILRNVPWWLQEARLRGMHEWREALRQEATMSRARRQLGAGQSASRQPRFDELWGDRLPASYCDFLETQLAALLAYQPHPYAGRVTLFRARSQSLLHPHDPDLGWNRLAGGGVDMHWVPGTHGTALREPYAPVLAAKLTACLHEAELG